MSIDPLRTGLEIGEFQAAYERVIERAEEDTQNRVPYFLRRAVLTLVEFRSGLLAVRSSKEFKDAIPKLEPLDLKVIVDADKFLQKHSRLINDLRNEFGGHIQARAVVFATTNLTNEIGRVTWCPGASPWTIGIECDFAATLLAGVLSSKLQSGGDTLGELRRVVNIMSKGLSHAQAAMVGLVHGFLWDSFGR